MGHLDGLGLEGGLHGAARGLQPQPVAARAGRVGGKAELEDRVQVDLAVPDPAADEVGGALPRRTQVGARGVLLEVTLRLVVVVVGDPVGAAVAHDVLERGGLQGVGEAVVAPGLGGGPGVGVVGVALHPARGVEQAEVVADLVGHHAEARLAEGGAAGHVGDAAPDVADAVVGAAAVVADLDPAALAQELAPVGVLRGVAGPLLHVDAGEGPELEQVLADGLEVVGGRGLAAHHHRDDGEVEGEFLAHGGLEGEPVVGLHALADGVVGVGLELDPQPGLDPLRRDGGVVGGAELVHAGSLRHLGGPLELQLPQVGPGGEHPRPQPGGQLGPVGGVVDPQQRRLPPDQAQPVLEKALADLGLLDPDLAGIGRGRRAVAAPHQGQQPQQHSFRPRAHATLPHLQTTHSSPSPTTTSGVRDKDFL